MPIIKQTMIYFFLSLLVVLFANYAHLLVVYLDMLYTYLNMQLMPIFSKTSSGVLMRNVVLLILIPLAITSIPQILYRLIKRKNMPYFIETTWIVWGVLVLSKLLIH